MAKYLVYLLILVCFLNIYNAKVLDFNGYLDEKYKSIQEMFNEKTHWLYKRDSNNVMIKKLQENMYPELTDYIKMLSLSNTTDILTKSGIYEVSENSTIFLNKIRGRLEKISEIENIVFFKSIMFNGVGFIILKSKLTGDSYIYQFIDGNYHWLHPLQTPDATDGHFFINNNHLYLVIANNKGYSLVETSIYKWLGFHFDEIQTVFTTGAIKVGSFTTRAAEIIIILQDIANKAIPSAVFEFTNDEIKKIQRIKTYHCIHLETYTSNNKNYVVIFTQSRNQVIYGWNDYQLILRSKFETKEIVNISQIFKFNNRTLFLGIPFCNKLQIHHLYNGKIKLVIEEQYPSNLTKIIDFHTGKNGTSYIIGLDEKNSFKMYLSIFNFNDTELNPPARDILRECFTDLEIKVDDVNNKLNGVKSTLSDKAKFQTKVILKAESLIQESPIETQIQELQNRFNKINSSIENYIFPAGNNIFINGKVTFKGRIDSEKLTGHNVIIKNMNGQKWTPEQWLRFTEPQTITGLSKIKTINCNHIETSSTDPLFKDLLLKSKDQLINGSISIDSLTVTKLYAKNINDIPMEQVYFKNKPEPIKGVKTFKFINVDKANVATINEDEPGEIISSVLSAMPNLDLDSNITIENLEVETINGVPWEEFKNSLFRINITDEITGPITFSKIKAKNLHVKKIKDVVVNNLLTTTTDQVIESKMKFTHIFTNHLKVENVNGVKIPQDVVFINENNTVKGPVKFDKMKVHKNLTLSGKFDDSFFLKDGDHIIGTKESDLLQIYSGKVIINGNLRISNLKLLKNANFFISEMQVDPNFTDTYWTKNTHQKIPVHVNFLQGISIPHLLTKVLNNVNIDQYLLNDNRKVLETDFKFENITVMGNVILRDTAQHKPDLNKILEKAVQTNGNYVIHGKKTYLDTLKPKNLQTSHLEGISVGKALNKKWPQNVTGTKTIKNVIIKNDAVTNIHDIKTINGVSLENFLQNFITTDQPVNITNLDFENVNVVNLHIQKSNDHNLGEYNLLKEKLLNTSVIDNLNIKGNCNIGHIKNMTSLNNIPFSDLLKNTPKFGKHGILDEVEFTGKIKVKNFKADHVNDISLRNLTRKILNRHLSQTIVAPYTFTNLKADNILTKKINNVSVENVIDTRSTLPQKIFSPDGTVTLSNILVRYLDASLMKPCDLDVINREFSDPPTQKWTEIVIKGNVTLLDEECLLYRVFEKTVKLNYKNIIHSNVDMLSHVSIKNLHTGNLINNVNIPDLLEDAVLAKSDEEQKITGNKWFTTLQTKEADILGNADTDFINEENITALNSDIVDKNTDEVIRGKKTFFRGLQTHKFNVLSKIISRINVESIVNLDQPKLIPQAIFETVDVKGNLNIKFYDRKNFTDILEKRLLTNGLTNNPIATGIYFFEHLEAHNFTTPSINDIRVDDIVFDISTQDISALKQFKRPVNIHGNVTVDLINGINITQEFIYSIPLEGFVEINGSITLLKPSNINGSLTTESINGFPVATIKEILSSNITKIETQEIYYIKEQLIEKINHMMPIVQGLPNDDFMYLEKSKALQITLPRTISASTITSNGFVLLHINGIESGNFCGLPNNCSCPVQYTIEVSPHNSVNMFPNKGFQRLFSYEDDSLTANFMTNSVSRSSNCRTSQSKVYNEISMLTWNTKTKDDRIGQFHQYEKFLSGYVSKVDFFTVNGKTYTVVGRYYNPVTDNYELDCSVLRFNDEKTSVFEIQIIPTKGVQEVYILQTAQGVVLVLGNKLPFDLLHKQEDTQIFRFNSEKEQFVHLRTIPSFGCSSAVGVVQGSDSLIALAHNEAPVQVLKYYPEFDNYYFYQSFELDEPVIGISAFYTGGFGISNAYLCLVTSHEKYYIYTYHFLEGFKLKSTGKLEGLRNFVPFELNMQTYLLALSAKFSSVLTVVRNGSN